MKEKKIGIMSMQRIPNYGSFLQAYALRKMIYSLGYHDVRFVDYKYERDIIESDSDLSLLNKIILHRNIIKYIRLKNFRRRFREQYQKFLQELNVDQMNYTKNVDTLVIGSDEVFNCMQHYPVGYSRGLFGKGYEKSDVISYAGSFGHTTLEELKAHGVDIEIGEMFNKFKAISVRDNNSKTIVDALTGTKHALVHLDPVLIGDFGDIFDRPVGYDNYIIVYAYSGRLTSAEEKAIRQFAKQEGKKIISLGFYQKCADYNLIIEPLDVLAYFRKADFVITDTFHGTIFSMKANTNFCTMVRESNKNKLGYLLKKMCCESRLVTNVGDLSKIYHSRFDFANCNEIIEKETNRTKHYLKTNL